jgi:nicotinamide-nucleotide amidase
MTQVESRLASSVAERRVLVRRVVKMAGRIESHTEEVLRPLYATWREWPVPVEATILAMLGQIELHLTARSLSRLEAEAALERAAGDVRGVLGEDVFSSRGDSLEHVVGDLLVARGYTIALAESCTGGAIASRLTDVPGSSRYLEQGVVAYSNAAKVSLLGVAPSLLAEHGAVSEPVGRAMAEGIRERAGVDVAIGVTGIAGPGGGTPDKPVGTVVIAATVRGAWRVGTFRFGGEREQVKFQASQAALDAVRRLLLAQ